MAVMQSSGAVLYVYFVVLCQCTNCSLKHVYIVFFYTVVHIVILYRCTHLFLTQICSLSFVQVCSLLSYAAGSIIVSY